MTSVSYHNSKTIDVEDLSLSLLQISLKHGIPHVHACGGHAKCSTCRVIICQGSENVRPRNAAEELLAKRKGFEPDVRLACQTHITGPVAIRRLVLDDQDAAIAVAEEGRSSGRDIPLAILFSDIRDFTPFAEANLPYDVVHILNRYFLAVGDAVLNHGGFIDKYIGDGMMALFGISGGDPQTICLSAVKAGLSMLDNLADLNRHLRENFDISFGMRIGIHYGHVVIGQVGHPKKMQFTALGDAVNTASRIESAVKGTMSNLLVSEAVFTHVKDLVRSGFEVTTELKGKAGPHRLIEIVGLGTA